MRVRDWPLRPAEVTFCTTSRVHTTFDKHFSQINFATGYSAVLLFVLLGSIVR